MDINKNQIMEVYTILWILVVTLNLTIFTVSNKQNRLPGVSTR